MIFYRRIPRLQLNTILFRKQKNIKHSYFDRLEKMAKAMNMYRNLDLKKAREAANALKATMKEWDDATMKENGN